MVRISRLSFVFAIFVSFFASFTTFAIFTTSALGQTMSQSFIFNRDLQFGDNSSDVLNLQKFLNIDADTMVAISGVGSRGNETSYFGGATREAVIRFQNKYKKEILLPVGLSYGTGRVGPQTRLMLNSLNIGSAGTLVNTTGTLTTASGTLVDSGSSKEKTPTLSYPSMYAAPAGTQIYIYGSDFSSTGNIVYFKPQSSNPSKYSKSSKTFTIENLSASVPSLIALNVPVDISAGRYEISLSNRKGKAPQKTFFVVTSAGAPTPTITRVEPSSGGLDTTIKIIGDHFSATGNEIRSSFGIISNLKSPDGKTLTFKLNPQNTNDLQLALDSVPGLEWKVYFHAVNSNGVSDKDHPGIYIIKN